jgi:hypothetical protein
MDLIQCLEYVTANFDEILRANEQGNDNARWILRAVELVDEQRLDHFLASMFCSYTEKYKQQAQQ